MNSNIIKNDTDLFVSGEIGYDFLAQDFIKQLSYLDGNDTINVHIYSGGGSLFEALAIYDFVKLKGIKFNAYISGLSGSAATIIGAASQNTYIGANSFYFVHRAYQSGGEVSEESQRLLDNANERIISIYKDLTNLTRPQIKQLLDAGDKGDFITSKDAIKYGFVNSEFKEAQLAASIDWYKTINNNMDKPTINVEELKNGIVTEVMNSVKDFFTKKEKEVSNEALEKTVLNEVNTQVEQVVNSYEEKIVELNNSKENEVSELKNKVTELEKQVNELKVVPTQVENAVVEPNPDGEVMEEVSENVKAFREIMSNLSMSDKMLINKSK